MVADRRGSVSGYGRADIDQRQAIVAAIPDVEIDPSTDIPASYATLPNFARVDTVAGRRPRTGFAMAAPMLPLPRRQPDHSIGSMALFRSFPAVLGVVLAMFAMLGIVAVTGWHSGFVHDHDRTELRDASDHLDGAVSIDEDDHGSSHEGEPDNPVHVLAHAASHWIGFGDISVPTAGNMTIYRAWVTLVAPLVIGLDPSQLLRPPRG
ncbi:hypothetical protein [Sphingomonas sp. Leaf62]|uniref:hypothetical protein n=1 Tax=Sphingomonas sp. Leaf62 TaxID=1736228 RepID=UPI000A703D24|nr:hypothetical protein [Sphingomonas sp. Leaf62]